MTGPKSRMVEQAARDLEVMKSLEADERKRLQRETDWDGYRSRAYRARSQAA